jgi:hypothetical protein
MAKRIESNNRRINQGNHKIRKILAIHFHNNSSYLGKLKNEILIYINL